MCVSLFVCVCESAESLALSLCFNTKSLLEGGAKKEAETDGATVDGSGARSGGPRRHPFTYITGFLHCFGANVTAGPVKEFFTCVQLCKGSQSGAFSGFSKWGGTGGDHEDSGKGGKGA